MTPLLLAVAGFLFLIVFVIAVLDWLCGPDTDLDGWDPRA